MDSATPKQIKGEIYSALRKGLAEPKGKSKKSWADGFIQEMLNEAKKNPNGALTFLHNKSSCFGFIHDNSKSSKDLSTTTFNVSDTAFSQTPFSGDDA